MKEIELSKKLYHANDHNDNVVLSVQGVSKKYCRNLKRAMFYGMLDILGELFGLRGRERKLRKQEFWALDKISFELRRGEALGLVGANGAGKTTLLKIISGLIKPDAGSVTVRGKIAPLIALGAGFNPILSGRENIYVNMGILGLTKEQIDDKFSEVVSFAELADAIDAPVQTYSSGMAARLGFACAIHTDPEILLIDEVLAVGDIKFRSKCYRKLALLRESGVSFILVSHSAQSLMSVCNVGVFLKEGKVSLIGAINEIISLYENIQLSTEFKDKVVIDSSIETAISEILFESSYNNIFYFRKESRIRIIIKSTTFIRAAKILLIIRSQSIEADYALYLDSDNEGFTFDINDGTSQIVVTMMNCGLRSGSYFLKAAIVGPNHYVYHAVDNINFIVKNDTKDINSFFYQPVIWDR